MKWLNDIVDLEIQADNKWMKNKKKRSAEEITQTRKKAKFDKVTRHRITSRHLSHAEADCDSAPKFDPENDKSILELQAERSASNGDDSGSRLTPMRPTASISTLRQKLQDKIDSLRKGRKAPLNDTERADDLKKGKTEEDALSNEAASDDGSLSDGDNDTLASRDEMLEARRKKRGEVRDNRRRRRKEERRAGKEATEKRKPDNKPGEKSKAADFTSKPGKVSGPLDSAVKFQTR